LWRIIRTAILVIGVLLSFLALVEVLHVYVILRDAYSPLGYAFLLLITVGFIWFLIYIFLGIKKWPRVLTPPNIGDFTSASQHKLKSYCRYLIRYFERLTQNPHLTADDINLVRQNVFELERLIESDQQSTILLEKIDEVEKKSIEPLLSKLNEKAEAEVRKCVRDIMLGVTLNPFRAVDLIIVIYRNASMVIGVFGIYNSRPLLSEQMLIIRDILRIVATVNYMNYGQKLTEQLISSTPIIGRASGELAQGFGAGLLTSLAGHSAVYRCSAYRPWNQEISVQTMSTHAKTFMNDVSNILIQDVFPLIKNKLFSTIPTEQIQKMIKAISTAVDEATERLIADLIKKPVKSVSEKTVKAGSNVSSKTRKIFVKSANSIWRGPKLVASGTGKGVRYAGKKLSAAYKVTTHKKNKER